MPKPKVPVENTRISDGATILVDGFTGRVMSRPIHQTTDSQLPHRVGTARYRTRRAAKRAALFRKK